MFFILMTLNSLQTVSSVSLNNLEREIHLHLEILVRLDAVSRDTHDIAVELGEIRV